jgi:hypothetical protein
VIDGIKAIISATINAEPVEAHFVNNQLFPRHGNWIRQTQCQMPEVSTLLTLGLDSTRLCTKNYILPGSLIANLKELVIAKYILL